MRLGRSMKAGHPQGTGLPEAVFGSFFGEGILQGRCGAAKWEVFGQKDFGAVNSCCSSDVCR